MDFVAMVDQVIALLRQRGRVAYRTLQRQFQLDDAALADLKIELIDSQRLATDEQGTVLVWTGEAASPPAPVATPELVSTPLDYTPSYLAEKILTSRSALAGERKQVTVLFADLKGSMELLADRDPEEARHLLDPVLERMMAAVHRYEGTVNQVMGDGIMALFGAPLAHEDHAVRACYAALAMQTTMQQYAAEVQRTHGVPLQMRIGLNAGEVVVRVIGNDLHMDYSAIGQTTHLAARMEQMALPGTSLITLAVLGLVEGYVQVRSLGPVLVKGLDAPVEVFELLRASGIQRRLQAAAVRGLTHFIGRDTELAILDQALERAGGGHGQVVAVVGEAGVGKSRLLYECIHSHHTQGWRVLESASVSYGRATPYFPVIDLLKQYVHVEDADEPRAIRAKVTGQVLTLDETLQDTIPAFLWLLDALPDESPFRTLDPPQRRQRLLDALKRVLLRESQVQPLLLVCEDLHWIDTETQALLDRLVDSLPTGRILLLVNYRPEYQHGWSNKASYTQLRLDPLPPASADAVLQALLGDDPSLASLTPQLIARTEGNPFFLEESVRALVETGGLVGERGVYRLAHALQSLHMPATVQAVLAARIDRLPPEEKRLLQTAAVIGMEVPLPLLQAIDEAPEESLQRSLAQLQATEFLYETRLFPEHEYTFKHALTHDVAYGSLLMERRRVLHARIVEALEERVGERAAEVASGAKGLPVGRQGPDQVDRLAHHALRLSPLIGRQPEVEALQQALALAGAGQGQVVALLGEPGVGKSRLVYEFVQSRQTQGWLRLESSSVSYGKATAYLPVCDLLKAYCQIADRDAVRTVQAKITGQILTLDATLQETVPAVLALFEALPAESPFLQLDPVQRRRQTLEALKRILLRESQVQPLLLVFEDLHWIDSETQALLDSLVESLPTARLLVLVNYRPEYQHGWGSKTFYTQLRLDPLPPASAEALLQALLGADASLVPLTQLLMARTQGNPFFLEESVRTLVETAVLVGDRGAYHLAQPLETLQVPATVQALLAARIDRLPPEDKRLLQTAAVIGTEVPWPLLQAIADTPDEALSRSLDHLQAAEFLYETSLFPEPAYTFKHALTHEVASGSLLHERRRALHARIVEALEALVGDRRDDQVERLAHHALRGDVWDKALAYGRQAGDKAQTRSAYREAVTLYEQALVAYDALPDSRAATEQAIDLRLGLRTVLTALGEPPGRMRDHLRHAETLAVALGDPLRLGHVYATLSTNCWVIGEVDRAIDYGQRTLALADTLGHIGLQARAHLSLGQVYGDSGDYAHAIASLEWNVANLQGELRSARFGANGIVAATSRTYLSDCHAECGTFTEGLALAEEGLRIAESVPHPFSLIAACRSVSGLYLRQGDVQRALPVLERGMALCQDWNILLLLPELATALGLAYALDGRVAAGVALVEQWVDQEAAMHRSRRLALMVAWLSEAYLRAGRLEDARQRATQALDLARQYQQRGTQAWALWLLGESTVCQVSPEDEPAAGHYREALALAEELGMRPLQAHCHRGLGTLYAATGQREQARTELSMAMEMYRGMEMIFWLPETEAALAQVEDH